jgi:hypothetical protein
MRQRATRAIAILIFLLAPALAKAQGGPPYYTNDPGTPGIRNWEINVGYMPFLYSARSTSHIPDLDLNYGVGDRIQLTLEIAWLRVQNGVQPARDGLEQDQIGVKWRFYDNAKSGLAISIFPQVSINNPNNSVARGIAPSGASLLLPIEMSKSTRRIDLNWELGYNAVQRGPNGWIAGLVAGRDMTKKLELDVEFYGLGAFNGSNNQQTVGAGARYKLWGPFTLLMMAGRSVAPSSNFQPTFVGYFGVQFLLPPNRKGGS